MIRVTYDSVNAITAISSAAWSMYHRPKGLADGIESDRVTAAHKSLIEEIKRYCEQAFQEGMQFARDYQNGEQK
jgi:hypothetical protein